MDMEASEGGFSSSTDWDITKQSFIPTGLPRKVTRGWERVPVTGLQGKTVWKKVDIRKYATSKDIDREVEQEAAASGNGPRKRIRWASKRDCIQDATWATPQPADMPHLESSLTHTAFDFEDTRLAEETKGTFPNIHYVPRKRTYTDQIITPKKAERSAETVLTEEAKRLLNTEVVHGSGETTTRRRKSARMSMAGRRVTLGAPNLGLESPLKATPLRDAPVKIFQSGGGDSGDPGKVGFGSNTLSRSTRRTTVDGVNELPTPSKPPVRRSSRRTVSRGQKSLSILPDIITAIESNSATTKSPADLHNRGSQKMYAAKGKLDDPIAEEESLQEPSLNSAEKTPDFGIQSRKMYGAEAKSENPIAVGDSLQESSLSTSERTDAAKKDSSPKRKRKSSPKAATRKSLRLSIHNRAPSFSRVEDRSIEDAEIPMPSERDVRQPEDVALPPETSSEDDSERETPNVYELGTSGELQELPTEAPDLSRTNLSRNGGSDVGEDSQNPTSTTLAEESISVPLLSNTTESVAIFSSQTKTDECTTQSDDGEGSQSIPDESAGEIFTITECIEEEAPLEEDAEVPGNQSSPEQKASVRLRSLSPAFEDLLILGNENTSILLSPTKNGETELSKCSPMQLGNILLKELDSGESSDSPQDPEPVGNTESPPSEPNDSATGIASDNLDPTASLSPHDDTIMLKNFVTRVRASRAANVQEPPKSSRKRSLPHSPMRFPLADVDSNLSPSPQKASPSSNTGRRVALVETPSVLKSNKAGKRGTPIVRPDSTEPSTIRRSGRVKTPVKGASTSSLPVPVSAPSSIPLRRLGGGAGDNISDAAFALKQKVDKELAALTRINTKKNAGPHVVKAFLRSQASKEITPEAADIPSKKSSSKKKYSPPASPTGKSVEVEKSPVKKSSKKQRKTVKWAEKLVQFQESESSVEGTSSVLAAAALKVGVRSASVASKIAIGMGIGSSLIPDLVGRDGLGLGVGKDSVGLTREGVLSGGGVGGAASLPVAVKKTPQKQKASKIATPKKTGKSQSKAALGMGVNGTPAPKGKKLKSGGKA